MPYHFKNNENIKLKHSNLYLIGAGFIMFMAGLNFAFFRWNWQDVLNMGLGVFIIWGVRFNGYYRIARYLTEQRLRRKDNRFDYYSR